MRHLLFHVLLASVLVGCATAQHAVVPSLEGKPRIPINKEKPSPIEAPAKTANQPLGEQTNVR